MDLRTLGTWIARASMLIAAGVTVAFVVFVYTENEKAPWMPPGRLLAFVAYTTLVFWSVIREYRPSWPHPTFWLWIVGFIGAHLIAYVLVLGAIAEWRLIWFLHYP